MSKYFKTPLDLGKITLIPIERAADAAANCKTEPLMQNVPRMSSLRIAEGERYRGGPVVAYVIRRDGSVHNVRLLRSSGVQRIDSMLVAAVKKWQYKANACPGDIDTKVYITIDFR